jgi:hypothetical protein
MHTAFMGSSASPLDVLDNFFDGANNTSALATHGYRVIQVYERSPASNIFKPFHDVIVGMKGAAFKPETCTPHSGPLHTAISQNENKPIKLDVYNNVTKAVRGMVTQCVCFFSCAL